MSGIMVTGISRKELFSTVFAQQFSPCGNYLVAANSLGKLAVYHITNVLSVNAMDHTKMPMNIFTAHDGAIYCLTSTERFLISGGSKRICGWLWTDILQHKVPFLIYLILLFVARDMRFVANIESNSCYDMTITFDRSQPKLVL